MNPEAARAIGQISAVFRAYAHYALQPKVLSLIEKEMDRRDEEAARPQAPPASDAEPPR